MTVFYSVLANPEFDNACINVVEVKNRFGE